MAGQVRNRSRILERCIYYGGDTIFREGDSSDTAYIIESGRAEIFKSKGGTTQHFGEVGPGEVIGEMGLIDGSPRAATVRASIETICLPISKTTLDGLLAGADPGLRALFKTLVHRLRQMNERLMDER